MVLCCGMFLVWFGLVWLVSVGCVACVLWCEFALLCCGMHCVVCYRVFGVDMVVLVCYVVCCDLSFSGL